MTKQLVKLNGIMPDNDKWVISSSGHHMFVKFSIGNSLFFPGFIAKIHYGNVINDIKIIY